MTRSITTQDLSSAFTVRQLIEELQEIENQDAPVLFVCNYGDYHKTQQALMPDEVLGEYTTKDIQESAYSQSGYAFTDDGEEREDDEWMCNNESCEDHEELWNIPTCPTCGKPCVNEQGETYDPENDDDTEESVVIIRC